MPDGENDMRADGRSRRGFMRQGAALVTVTALGPRFGSTVAEAAITGEIRYVGEGK